MPSDYLLIPEYPTASQVREFVSEQMGELFGRVSADRHITGDMPQGMETRYHEAINAVARSMVEWIEVRDPKVPHWGMPQ